MQEVVRFVRLIDAANTLGVHVNTVCRRLENNNITILRTGPQPNADRIISNEDYERLCNIVQQSRERIMPFKPPDGDEHGAKGIYAFTYAADRLLKIGWSDSLSQRICDHRSLAVDMNNLKTWPSPFKHDENNVLDIAKAMPLTSLGPEVFQIAGQQEVNEFCKRVDDLFRLLGRV